MADIKNYLKEKEKRQQNQSNYEHKIRKHRFATVYRWLLVVTILVAVGALIVVQYKKRVYTGYDVVSSIKREMVGDAWDTRLQDAVLTYSKDGAHCTNAKGEVTWNQTYGIQDIKVATCQDVVAIGNYNGRDIYVQSADKQLGSITTNLPIRNLTVSAVGNVTAILADTDSAWINTYSPQGELLYYGQTYMHNSGYPISLSLSPDGELLAVSYVYLDAGTIKTNVAFYNFGPVGANQSDYITSVHIYSDMLVPQVQFMNNDTAFAVGDNRLMIYKGDQKPVSAGEYLYDEEVQSVYYSEDYIGLVFRAEGTEHLYRMNVYGADAKEVGSYYIDMEYTDIFFEEGQFVVYNETECMIETFEEVVKYRGTFSKMVNLMLPANSAYKYVVVSDGSIDTIQLK